MKVYREVAAKSAIACTAMLLALPATGQEVSWDLALFGSPAFRVAGESLAEYVNENSGGSFKITVHEGSLSPAREVIDNLSIGAFEAGYIVSSYHPGKNPLVSVLDLPFLPIDSMEERRDVAEALFGHPAVEDEFAGWNTVPIMAVVQPNYEIIGKGEAPGSLADLDGLRMKATSGIGAALSEFGVTRVPMTGSEQYTGLQTGTIDSVAATPSAFGGWKLYEQTDWYTVGMKAGSAHVTLAANASAYEALSDEHKALLDEAEAYAYEQTIAAQTEAFDRYEPVFKDHDLTRVDVPDAWVATLREEAAEPVWQSWVDETAAKDLPARKVLDFVIETAE